MKKLSLLFLLTIIPILSQAQKTTNSSIMHDGIERSYLIYEPASYDAEQPTALVLCFHGYGSAANTIWFYSGFNKIADTANFLVAYPQGTILPGGERHWNVGGWTINSTTDDLGFTEALLDSIALDYSIDQERIYATGMSNGGFMSFLLACQMSERFAAVASVTGSMTPETYAACDPQRAVPVLQIHGTADATVPYDGDATKEPIEDVLSYWVNQNQTNEIARKEDIDDISEGDGSTVDKLSYAAGEDCSAVIHYRVDGGGHDWPGAFGNLDIEASAVVWDFFSQYDINGKINCDPNGEDAVLSNAQKSFDEIKLYPNPGQNSIRIEGDYSNDKSFVINTLDGRVILKGQLKGQDQEIDIASLQEGVYVLSIGEKSLKFIKQD